MPARRVARALGGQAGQGRAHPRHSRQLPHPRRRRNHARLDRALRARRLRSALSQAPHGPRPDAAPAARSRRAAGWQQGAPAASVRSRGHPAGPHQRPPRGAAGTVQRQPPVPPRGADGARRQAARAQGPAPLLLQPGLRIVDERCAARPPGRQRQRRPPPPRQILLDRLP